MKIRIAMGVVTVAVALTSVIACGKKSETSSSQGSNQQAAETKTSTAAAAATTQAKQESAGASDACTSCRDDQCGSEISTCKGDATCAKNLGCGDECKKDKACMLKCMKPNPKFAAIGKCIQAKCKSVCTS